MSGYSHPPLRSHRPQSLPFQVEGDTELPTPGSYFLYTLPPHPNPPSSFLSHLLGQLARCGQQRTPTKRATQSYLPGCVRLGHTHHLAHISPPLPQGAYPGGRPCWCLATQPEEQYPENVGAGVFGNLSQEECLSPAHWQGLRATRVHLEGCRAHLQGCEKDVQLSKGSWILGQEGRSQDVWVSLSV